MQLEGTVKELWSQFQQALRSYNEATEDRHIAFEALRNRDQKSAQEIDMQMRRLQKMQVRGWVGYLPCAVLWGGGVIAVLVFVTVSNFFFFIHLVCCMFCM